MNHDLIRLLLVEINSKLFLLEGEKKRSSRQKILDELLEDEASPIKQLARLFEITI